MSTLFFDEGPQADRKVLLATTSYGDPAACYTFSIARSREALSHAGIASAYMLLEGNCHVDDARNAVVRDFLASDCTELVFLDADVSWEPKHLVRLCSHDLDIVGGVYPYRRDGGENMPVRLMDGAKAENGLLEVEGLPTGFLRIKRHVLQTMADRAPMYFDKFDATRLVFNRSEPDQNGTRWGGDIRFCMEWRKLGGKLYADTELRLGHRGDVVIADSLKSFLERVAGTALSEVVKRIREGSESTDDYNDAFKAAGNPHGADATVLALIVGVARKCRGPIIEMGSGVSSVLLGAVSDSVVYSLEHSQAWAAQTLAMCEKAGVSNVGVCTAPLKDGWYDLGAFDLPQKFTLAFCDGPPRAEGNRRIFFRDLAPRCEAIVVDDFKADHSYATFVKDWCEANGRSLQIIGRAALILKA